MNAGAALIRRVGRLLDEAKPGLSAVRASTTPPNVKAVVYSGGGFVYRLVHLDRLSAGLGFWASAMQPGAPDGVHIIAYALNTTIPEGDRVKLGKTFVQRLDEPQVMLSGWSEGYVQRSALAESVFEPGVTFAGQVDRAVAFLDESLAFFEAQGYLPGHLVD